MVNQAHTPDRGGQKLRLGLQRGKGAPHPGRVHPSSPGCLSHSDGEGTKRRRSFLFRAFAEHPRAGTARSTGHVPYRAAGSLSSLEGKTAPVPPHSVTELAT